MPFILVDVEADGISPASGEMTEFGAVEYKSLASFHGLLIAATPDPKNPAKPLILPNSKRYDEAKVMFKFKDWLNGFKDRPIFVSDNPAYDFQWINFYFDKYVGSNPFGHSGRRISDFWAGLELDWGNTQKWKKYRVTPHTHNPVDDAMGNAEALRTILDIAKQRLEDSKQPACSRIHKYPTPRLQII